MKAVFLGGGSLRLLPIFRGLFLKAPEVFRNGEIRLVDRFLERAEAVGKLVLACPEYQNVGCKVIWTDDLDAALQGIDVFYLTMAAIREPSNSLAALAGDEFGYYSSDNLSINGAFLSLRLGKSILGMARKMEKACPQALMLIFPNPIAVYSALVNNFTKIRALGICGGYNNHRWDLTRLCGRNEFDPAWDVVAAGVNHLSFILRGNYKGEDLYGSLLPRILHNDWRCPEIQHHLPEARKAAEDGLHMFHQMYQRYGTLIFSSESDGIGHLFWQYVLDQQHRNMAGKTQRSIELAAKDSLDRQNLRFDEFIQCSKKPETVNWNASSDKAPLFCMDTTDITIPIFQALTGQRVMRIVASRPNRGAVAGFPDHVPLEYTMDLHKNSITAVENQYIPAPFHGLIASLAEFQSLQAEAIAKNDARIFANALDAYPIHAFQAQRIPFFRKMFDIYQDLDPDLLAAAKFFQS